MARRQTRIKLVHRLVSPIATRIRTPIRRVRRQFAPNPLRWSLSQRSPFSKDRGRPNSRQS